MVGPAQAPLQRVREPDDSGLAASARRHSGQAAARCHGSDPTGVDPHDDPALSQAIRHEEEFAARNGIRSVPTFVVNGKYILQGSSEPENFRQALVKLASMEAMA